MTGLIVFLAGVSAFCAVLWAVGEFFTLMDGLRDRRHIARWNAWRDQICDLPVRPLAGSAGHVSLLPGFPAGSFPGVPRTNVLARTPGKGSGQSTT